MSEKPTIEFYAQPRTYRGSGTELIDRTWCAHQ